jgi:hypothetical protein
MEKFTTVLSFNNAVIAGYEPRIYSWDKADIPTGEYMVCLDFMIWSKKQMAINCYFTVKNSGAKISLSAYRNRHIEQKYLAGKTEMRFITFGSGMEIKVQLNSMGKPSLQDAVVKSILSEKVKTEQRS